jgi:hypothetical protein
MARQSMHPVGFPSRMFCTIILQIGHRFAIFVEEILLFTNWFPLWEKYVKLVQIIYSPYFLVHHPVDGCSSMRHYFYQVSPRLLQFPTLVDLCPAQIPYALYQDDPPHTSFYLTFCCCIGYKVLLFYVVFYPILFSGYLWIFYGLAFLLTKFRLGKHYFFFLWNLIVSTNPPLST